MEPTATAFASPIPEPSCEAIIGSGELEMTMALPVSLTAKGATYPVEPIVPREDAWTYPSEHSGSAVWVCGTVVNYVIGLEPTAESEELVRSLAPGDRIKLRLTNGVVLRFRFVERQDVAPGGESALAQQRPRLTLVLPKSDTWQIATADYAAGAEAMEPPAPEATAQPGEPVQVDQTRVTMVRGYVEQRDDLPSGTAYYLTEFSIENVGEAPIATDTISVKLRDSLGNTYLASTQASRVGEFGPLDGEIEPGASAQASAGFLVPSPLSPGELIWIFSLRPGAEEVRVSIPHEPETDGEPVALQPDVRITDAFLDDGGSVLVIEGEIGNRGDGSLVVDRADIALSSSEGTSALVMAAPSLPWTVEPGQVQVIELQYTKPNASTVLLEVLGYSFEIGGLR
jgi:hypothetical protein